MFGFTFCQFGSDRYCLRTQKRVEVNIRLLNKKEQKGGRQICIKKVLQQFKRSLIVFILEITCYLLPHTVCRISTLRSTDTQDDQTQTFGNRQNRRRVSSFVNQWRLRDLFYRDPFRFVVVFRSLKEKTPVYVISVNCSISQTILNLRHKLSDS